MELRHLRYFEAVAGLLNFTRAAERLHVAQPALSRQIRSIEEELGVKLFERDHAHVRLTDAGRTFYPHVRRLLAQVDSAVAAVQEVKAGVGGEFVVCTDWRLGGDLVSATLAQFHEAHPRATITLLDLGFRAQVEALRAGQAQVGFVARDLLGLRAEFESLPVLRSPLVAVLPATHRFARRRRLRLAELAAETWTVISEQQAAGYRSFLVQLCRLSGFHPRLGPEAAKLEGLLGRVAGGLGIGLLPAHVVPPRTPLLRCVATDCRPVELCAVWNRGDPSSLLQAYLAILRAHLATADRN